MFFAVLKSFLVVAILALAGVGGVAATAVIGLALGQFEMPQIVDLLQQCVDNSQYYLGAWGVTSAMATVRAMRPFVVAGFRNWLSDVVKNHVLETMTRP